MSLNSSLDISNLILRRNDFTLDVKSFNPKIGVTALVGASGSGKTSFLRVIAGLEKPEQGQINISSNVVFDASKNIFIKPQKRKVGYVFQTPRLVPFLSVLKNISLFSLKQDWQKELIENLGITPLLSKKTGSLSGGEAQRVALARSLVAKPSILLLDEPLSAIDERGKEDLLEFFASHLPSQNIPIIYVTHSLKEAGTIAKNFSFIKSGKITDAGSASKILSPHIKNVDDAISSVLSGKVAEIADDGLVSISVGKQKVELFCDGLKINSSVSIYILARDIILAKKPPQNISARNALTGVILDIIQLNKGMVEVKVRVEKSEISAILMARTITEMGLINGSSIVLLFKSASVSQIL